MEWKELEPLVNDLRVKQIETMNIIEQFSSKCTKLPNVSTSFKASRDLLKENEYNVVVCGEVKKGKSSLLNAIIGHNILPVNNEIATSQVFRISNSKEESFYLVFSDGKRHQITKEELYRYGAQTAAVQQGEPIFKDRNLSFIQVNTPVTFLPEGVSLVDTPGLGALYATHEHITNNYLSQASAVIFVLDPDHPITIQEKKFIMKALQVTKEIIYVMTKIDKYTPETWSLQLKRNQAILEGIYSQLDIPAPQILPVSSKSLMDAATETDEFFSEISMQSSKFTEVKETLIKSIFHGVGILRSKQAMDEMANAINKYYTVINDMIKVCTVDSKVEQQKINERRQAEQKRLQEEWGEKSQQRQQIIEEISAICNSLNGRVAQIINQVRNEVLDVVNGYSSLDEVERAARNLPQAIYDEVSSRWQTATRDVSDKVAAVLSNVNSKIVRIGANNISQDTNSIALYEMTFNDRMNAWRGGFFLGSAGASLAGYLGAFAFPVVGPIVGIAIGLATLFTGKSQTENIKVQQNKRIISNHVTTLLNDMNSKLVHVQPGKVYSEVGKFQHDIIESAKKAINVYFAKCKEQLEQEMKDIEAQAKADVEKRQRDAVMWNGLNNEVKQIALAFNQQKVLFSKINEELQKK